MPNARTANAVRLEFTPGSLVQANLSGAAFTGDWLWVAGDEACGLDRLRRLDPVAREVLRFGQVRDFPLADLLDLPGTAGEEADLEGMAVADGFLWVVGSHGLKRKSVKPDRSHADNAGQLAKVALDGLGVRDLHFSGYDLYILAGPTMALNGEICVFKWPAARPLLAANRDPVRFEAALTESVSLPHGRGTNRAEAICDLLGHD
jgi:hypothetical protein